MPNDSGIDSLLLCGASTICTVHWQCYVLKFFWLNILTKVSYVVLPSNLYYVCNKQFDLIIHRLVYLQLQIAWACGVYMCWDAQFKYKLHLNSQQPLTPYLTHPCAEYFDHFLKYISFDPRILVILLIFL